jgi:hypothetical protein
MAHERPCLTRRVASFDEHFLESPQHRSKSFWRQSTKPLDESFSIDCSNLIERHEPGTTLKAAGHPPRVRLTTGRHRRDDGCAEVAVELVWRND